MRLAIARIFTLFPLIFFVFVHSAAGQDSVAVDGVVFMKTMKFQDTDFALVGAGLHRYRIVFRGYAAALYLGAGDVISNVFKDIPKRLEIKYYHAIPVDDFIDATREGMERNISREELQLMKPRLERLFRTYRPVRPGDRYAFTYVPGRGSTLTLNNAGLAVFEGLDFANAFLSIWLGPEPADQGLKKALLGMP